ncbi:MAG: DUF5680 domain-containing protein [Candidatus Hodarchaeales archaeon]|jgi:hypothetical protein
MRIIKYLSFILIIISSFKFAFPQNTNNSGTMHKKNFDIESLEDFLIKAKKNTYASQGDNASVEPLLPGTKQLEYQEGDFFYRDIYVGMSYFVGQEIIYFKNNPIWSMCYAGGVEENVTEESDIMQVYRYLRVVLGKVSKENIFRGPKIVKDDDKEYINESDGTIESFSGSEYITINGKRVYHLHYSGGIIK